MKRLAALALTLALAACAKTEPPAPAAGTLRFRGTEVKPFDAATCLFVLHFLPDAGKRLEQLGGALQSRTLERTRGAIRGLIQPL